MSNSRGPAKWLAIHAGHGRLHRGFTGSYLGMTCDCIYDLSPVSTATYKKEVLYKNKN